MTATEMTVPVFVDALQQVLAARRFAMDRKLAGETGLGRNFWLGQETAYTAVLELLEDIPALIAEANRLELAS